MKRLTYLDILKTIAIVAVVLLHVTGQGLMAYTVGTQEFSFTLIVNSLFRFAVPVFVMCSGALFLNPEKEIPVKKIFSKYLSRIVSALILFSVFYEVVEIIRVRNNTGVFDKAVIENSINNLLNFNTHYHLYYLYIVVILYLSVPVLKKFLQSATKSDILYLISFLTVFSSVLPCLRCFYPLNTYFKGMTLQYNLNLTYGMLTYFVLGYYLSHFEISKKVTVVLTSLGILGTATTFFGTYALSMKKGVLDETFLAGNFPNVLLSSVALFVLVKKINCNSKLFTFISKASFCIYLIHDLFIIIFNEHNFNILSFSPVLSIPLLTALIFTLSLVCYIVLSKVPLLKKIL